MFYTAAYFGKPYSSVQVTQGAVLLDSKTFYIMLRFTRIVQHGSSFFGSLFHSLAWFAPRRAVYSTLRNGQFVHVRADTA